jgi:hypothetical protein
MDAIADTTKVKRLTHRETLLIVLGMLAADLHGLARPDKPGERLGDHRARSGRCPRPALADHRLSAVIDDGMGCRDVPTLSGILSDGTRLHASKNDPGGSVCGKAQTYTSPSYVVPKPLPAGSVVVAANAGSDYLFVPDDNPETVEAAVISLQSRMQFGAVFVSDKYGAIAGTLPMSLINTENKVRGRSPDIIVGFRAG